MSKSKPYQVATMKRSGGADLCAAIRGNGTISLAIRRQSPTGVVYDLDTDYLTQSDLRRLAAILGTHSELFKSAAENNRKIQQKSAQLGELERQVRMLSSQLDQLRSYQDKYCESIKALGWTSSGGYGVEFLPYGVAIGCKLFFWDYVKPALRLVNRASKKILGK